MDDAPAASPTLPSAERAPDAPLDRRGLAATVIAFLIWGVLPLYLRPLRAVPPLEVMSHRIVWSCLLVCGLLAARGELAELRRALTTPGIRRRLILSATLITVNWLLFVWAASVGRVLDASLGYFINPLVNVLIGVLVLSERLSKLRWLAVALATLGVLWLGVTRGEVPWIALMLASSFSGYGLIRKTVAVEAVVGLGAETCLLTPLALGYLIFQQLTGRASFASHDAFLTPWLMAGALVTAVPLALFAYGARRIPYSTAGLIQYLGPTLQFACGVFVLGETVERGRLVGFLLIWSALGVFAVDTSRGSRGR